MPQPGRRRIRQAGGAVGKKVAHKKPRLKLKISKGLDALRALPAGTLTEAEQTVLRRIQDIHRGIKPGTLKATDLINMKNIARKYRVSF